MIHRDENWYSKENNRLKNLYELQVLDTPKERTLDNLTELAANICQTSMAFISLVDKHRLWFKSCIGIDLTEIPREISFCQYTIEQKEILEIIDAKSDTRFFSNPFVVGPPLIRYYAGIPLVTCDGFQIGTLCVIDTEPKTLNSEQRESLKKLGYFVAEYLENCKNYRKLKEMCNLKCEFLSNISHELRTPLNAIYGYTEILSQTTLTPQQNEYLSIIQNSVEGLTSLINELLDFSKIESGKFQIDKNIYNFQKAIDHVYALLKPKADSKKLVFQKKLDPRIPPLLKGDKIRVNQILVNLIGNAIKFTKEGSVSLEISKMDENEKEVNLLFSIKDTGIGIPEEFLNKIFGRFEQANKHISSEFGGTGLGLSISKSLVELQGGNLEVKSVFGKGSEFFFTLPFEKAQNYGSRTGSPIKNKKIDNKMFKGMKILVCEDNEINISLIQKIFENRGTELGIAKNGKEGLEMIEKKKFDLVLMDLNMPVLSGIEATIEIRSRLKMDVPIIGISANLVETEKNRCLDVGMNEYITKPFKIKELFQKIQKVFEKKKKLVINIDSLDYNKNKNNEKKWIIEEVIRKNFVVKPMKFNSKSNPFFMRKIKANYSEKLPNNEQLYLPSLQIIPPYIHKNYEKVDMSYLQNLVDNDPNEKNRMIEIFLQNVPNDLKILKEEISKKNYEIIKQISHKIKGSVAVYGLNNMMQQFSDIEKLTLEKNIKEIRIIFTQISKNLEFTFLDLKSMIKKAK